LPKLSRRGLIKRVLERNVWLIQVAGIAEAVALANQIAPEHWRVTKSATLVETGVSPAYLRDHLMRMMPAARRPDTLLLVTHVPADAAWNALPEAGEQWLRDALAP
jgi:hypothetical protein